MKIISWNINGLRAQLKKGLLDFIKNENADVYHFQEIKIAEKELLLLDVLKLFNTNIDTNYFVSYFCASKKKGYSGILSLTKNKPIKAAKGIGVDKFDIDGRVLTLEYKNYYLLNAYFPHTGRKLENLDFKTEFNEEFLKFLQSIKKINKPVIISGDINVAHTPKDIARSKENEGNAGYTQIERDYFTKLLKAGYIDTFRYLHPDKIKYTWWLQNFNARDRDVGWRIDYNLVSNNLANRITKAEILSNVYGSDHCPTSLTINLL